MAAKVLDGRYKLIKSLGSGGFGRTFIARDMRRPGTPPCVVKQLKPASDDPAFVREARRLFNTEAETLEKLGKHDQIPQLLAYFEEEGQFFLVQEYIEGRSLYDELRAPTTEPEDTTGNLNQTKAPGTKDKQLSEPEVVSLLKDVLGILDFVHSENVIHRDIKPDNLIRRKKDGKLVLIDFGAVKAMQESGSIETVNGESRFTVTIGTPGYMPSEQCAGRPSFSSDIYALGMVAIKALTGLDPTDLPTDPDTGEIIWRDRAKVSNGLCMVLTRMVRYHYTQRYQSAKEALQGLAAFSITEEVSAKPTPAALVKSSGAAVNNPTPRTKTIPKAQNKADSGSLWLVGGLLVMVGVTSLMVFRTNQKPTVISVTPVPAVTPVANTEAKPTPDATASPNATASPTASPSATASTGSNTEKQVITKEGVSLDAGKEVNKTGKLKANETVSYALSLKSNQKLRADLSGDNVVMAILNPSNETVSTSSSPAGTWEGKATTDGEYQVQVKPSQGKPEGNYNLKLTLTEDTPTRSIEIKVNTPPPKN